VERQITLAGVLIGLLVLAGAILTFSFAVLSALDGYGWQALGFSVGGAYLGGWVALRLTERSR
jgi:hypothetical protein